MQAHTFPRDMLREMRTSWTDATSELAVDVLHVLWSEPQKILIARCWPLTGII